MNIDKERDELMRLAQFLKDRQSCLGSSKDYCFRDELSAWDDYEKAWTALERFAALDEQKEAVKLHSSQWVNIVNHNNCWDLYSKEEAVREAVKMTEEAIKRNCAESDKFRSLEDKKAAPSDDHGINSPFDACVHRDTLRALLSKYAAPAQKATLRCAKCGEQASVSILSASIVTHLPDGTPRDERDIASDPEGKLIHDPNAPLRACVAPAPKGGSVAKVRDRGFIVADGQHVPTVLVEFPVNDWDSRDRFAAEIAAPVNEQDVALAKAIEQRDIAIAMLAEWCVAVRDNGTGWDDWDEHYKDVAYRPGPLRKLIDAAIAQQGKEGE